MAANGAAAEVAEGKEDVGEGKFSEGKDDLGEPEDDGMAFEIEVDAKDVVSSPTKAPPAGIGLDLSLANAARDQRQSLRGSDAKATDGATEEDLIEMEATTPVLVVFDLPDGSSVESEFAICQSVEVLKSYIASECGIQMGDQQLFLEAAGSSVLLMDPMSLSDYPQVG